MRWCTSWWGVQRRSLLERRKGILLHRGISDLGISLRQLNLAMLQARSRFDGDVERIRRNELDY